MYRLPLFAGLVITLVSIGSSQEAVEPAADRAPTASHRHLAIMVGLPGDDTHREQMTAAAEKLIRNVEQTLSVKPEHLTVLAGDAEMQETLSAAHESVGISNAKTVEQTLREASEKLTPSDAYWVIMIGHSHLNGIECQFNVTDRDFNQVDFAKWSEPVKCSEQVFWLTQPLSGLWIKPMAKPGRVVLTSTEADLEFTGTEMPYALADLLAGESLDSTLGDLDGDSKISLLDLYLTTCVDVTMRFRSIDRLQTEHGQLDDNGDGRGTEVQTEYLPPEPVDEDKEEEVDEEESEEEDENKNDAEVETVTNAEQPNAEPITPPKPELITSRNLDGFRSRFILLHRD